MNGPRSLGSIVVMSALTSLTACGEGAAVTGVDAAPSYMMGGGRGGGPGGGNPAPAELVVADGAGYRVTSDDGTPYIDGADKVALDHGIADFVFTPASKRKGHRFLSIDLTLGGPTPFPSDISRVGYPGNFRILTDLTAIPCGAAPASAGARFFWGPKTTGPLYHLSFGIEGVGDPVMVERVAAGSGRSTWTMQSAGTGVELTETSADVSFGFFTVPVRFTLEGTDEGC